MVSREGKKALLLRSRAGKRAMLKYYVLKQREFNQKTFIQRLLHRLKQV